MYKRHNDTHLYEKAFPYFHRSLIIMCLTHASHFKFCTNIALEKDLWAQHHTQTSCRYHPNSYQIATNCSFSRSKKLKFKADHLPHLVSRFKMCEALPSGSLFRNRDNSPFTFVSMALYKFYNK